jgi:hypothetical protein
VGVSVGVGVGVSVGVGVGVEVGVGVGVSVDVGVGVGVDVGVAVAVGVGVGVSVGVGVGVGVSVGVGVGVGVAVAVAVGVGVGVASGGWSAPIAGGSRRGSPSKSFVMPAMVKPAPTHGLVPSMCRSPATAFPFGLINCGSTEMLFASWLVAVCQSASVVSIVLLNTPITPSVAVAYRSLKSLVNPGGLGAVPPTAIAMLATPPAALLRAFQKMLSWKLRVLLTTSLSKAKVFDAETTPEPPIYTLLK